MAPRSLPTTAAWCRLVAVVAVVMVATGVHADEADVTPLTANTFDAAVTGSPVLLVKFFSPRCGHCVRFAPAYAAAATELKDVTKLAAVDCTVERGLCAKMNVKRYPTVFLFRGKLDGAEEYEKGRTTKDLVAFMRGVLPAAAPAAAVSETPAPAILSGPIMAEALPAAPSAPAGPTTPAIVIDAPSSSITPQVQVLLAGPPSSSVTAVPVAPVPMSVLPLAMPLLCLVGVGAIAYRQRRHAKKLFGSLLPI